jgi:hypothetical protein
VADEKKPRPVDLASARARGIEFGKHHFHGGTIHRFPRRSHIETQLRQFMLPLFELSELDHAKLDAAYEGAREEYERRRTHYVDAIKSGDTEAIAKIEAERDEHERGLRDRLREGDR